MLSDFVVFHAILLLNAGHFGTYIFNFGIKIFLFNKKILKVWNNFTIKLLFIVIRKIQKNMGIFKKYKQIRNIIVLIMPSKTFKTYRNTPFTKDEEIFIIKEFSKGFSSIDVKRKFRAEYGNDLRSKKLQPHQLKRVYDRFLRDGIGRQCPSRDGRKVCATGDMKKNEAANILAENPSTSLTTLSRDLQISKASAWRIVREKLKFIPYKSFVSQKLTEQHKKARNDFCNWFLEQPENFHRRVIWGDEKWFCLNPKPNRQNFRTWSLHNPHNFMDLKEQGGQKVMCFVAIINDKVIGPYWFQDESGSNVSVNANRYLKMLQDHIIPKLPSRLINRLWFMQDGATAHTSNCVMSFLREKFGNRIISRFAERNWPARSPDMNPLDFWLWGHVESIVIQRKPGSIDELKMIVESIIEDLNENPSLIDKVTANVSKRAKACVDCNGSIFEHVSRKK